MITLEAAQIDLLTAGAVVRRLFLTIDTTDDAGLDPQTVRLWDGLEDIDLGGDIYSALGGNPELSSIQQVLDGSIPGAMLTVSGVPNTPLADMVADESRRWHQRPAVISLGLFDPSIMGIVGSLIPLHRGYFDKATFLDAEVGGESTLQIAIESAAREMTRSNDSVRSDLDQRDRFTGDEGFEYVARDYKLPWGVEQKRGKGRHKGGGRKRGKR